MPRRSSGHHSEESPAPRRTSARIAAVQAASPAKSPAKSPRRKRRSTDAAKTVSEDTESQQSQLKSDCSVEELNGLETNSTKDLESAADSQELCPKKAKFDEDTEEPKPIDETIEVPKEASPVEPTHIEEVSEPITDFEVVEKSELPAPDSAEVNAAITAQGEDGQLLVGFVQVEKDELPSATSVEVKEVVHTEEPLNAVVENHDEVVPSPPAICPINGDVNGENHSDPADHIPVVAESMDHNVQSKMCPISDLTSPISAPAAGDSVIDNVETVSQ